MQEFVDFIITVLTMIVDLFKNTDIGGFTYESALVSITILSMLVGFIFLKK